MGRIPENWRVPAAGVFAVVLIVGAYILARGIQSPSAAEASTETALLKAIASKDSDNDGLPDWEESLYGTDPHNPDSNNLGMTDGEAVAKGLIVPKAITNMSIGTSTPNAISGVDYATGGLTPPTEGTLTDAFAKSFFTLYVAAKEQNGGNDLTSDQVSTLAEQTMTQFMQNVAPSSDFKSAADIKVSGTGPDALRAFAVAADAVSQKNTSDATKNEILYLQDVVENNDTTAVAHLTAIAKVYRGSAAGLAALSVPQELATEMLALTNAMMRVSGVIDDFSRVNTDPLTAMLALQQYLQASQALGDAFTDIGNVYATEGVILPAGTPGHPL
jgi:hypothetical protein